MMGDVFGKLFEERGMEGYDKGEKAFGSPDNEKEGKGEKRDFPRAPEEKFDLHGRTVAEVEEAVRAFVGGARQRGRRFVLVTFGIGRNSPEGRGKLRPVVVKTLLEMEKEGRVRKFRTAEPKDGGYGSMYVYLR